MAPAPNITLRIGEVILEGVSPREWRRIEDELRRELERLLASEGGSDVAEISVSIDTLDAGEFEIRPGQLPSEIGRRLARALFAEIAGGRR
jgi:hypothetical protein